MAAKIIRSNLKLGIGNYKMYFVIIFILCTGIQEILTWECVFQTGYHLNSIQWGSEIQTRLDFEWSKRGWVVNGPDFEWDMKSGSPTI